MEMFEVGRRGRALVSDGKPAHLSEYVLCQLFVDFDAKSRVSVNHSAGAGMLAEHQAMLAPDEFRVEALVVRRVLEHPVYVDAGFVREHTLADDTFVGGNRAS